MAVIRSTVEWHDIRIAPDDLPEAGEKVLITAETLDGSKQVRADVYLKELTNGNTCWAQKYADRSTGKIEEAIVWYEVTAWAYYPDPYFESY